MEVILGIAAFYVATVSFLIGLLLFVKEERRP